ncbi:MAG: hypothetical protein IH986_08430 [Planctomycetes bacterium]|nr:hypothetical protein [Planctomycetota bacterium]
MTVKLSSKMSILSQQAPETPFLLTFEVVNRGDSDIYVLKHGTSLEGLFSDCFEITRDGKRVPYDGPLVKRGAPTEKDYVRIRPGKSVISEVDLSSCYQVSVPGKYEVASCGALPDVVTRSELRAKAKSDEPTQAPVEVKVRTRKFTVKPGMHGRATTGEAARRQEDDTELPKAKSTKKRKAKSAKAKTPTITGGSVDQKKKAQEGHDDGYNLAVAARAALNNEARYKEWFGTHTATRFKTVKDVYTTVRDRMRTKSFTYDLSGTGCKPSWYAYTYKGTTKIWYCGAFCSAPATGTDSKAGTVLHEHSHASASTDDIAYGQSNCRQLAKTQPTSAVSNADNFEYYAGG